MAQQTGNSGMTGGHQQSIGADSPVPVDGINGSHPGTQQPDGAHVNAGKGGGGAEQRQGGSGGQRQGSTQDSPPARARVQGANRLAGMNGRGVAHLAGAVGMLGTPRAYSDADKALSATRFGSTGRQHASGQ